MFGKTILTPNPPKTWDWDLSNNSGVRPAVQWNSQPVQPPNLPVFLNASLKDEAWIPRLTEDSNREARSLLAEYLGAEVDPDSANYVSEISVRLEDTIIERQDEDLMRNVRRLCGKSTLEVSIQFVRYSVYLSSNNLLSESQTDEFLSWSLKCGIFLFLVEMMRLKLPTVEVLKSNLFLGAIRLEEIDAVRKILAIGIEVNPTRARRYSQVPLHEAVKNKNLTLTQLLLDMGADPNARGGWNLWTALEEALKKDSSLQLVQMLLASGANANIDFVQYRNTFLAPMLKGAVSSGDFGLIRVLLAAKASFIGTAQLRDIILDNIARSDNIGLVRMLFRLAGKIDNCTDRDYKDIISMEDRLEKLFESLMEDAMDMLDIKMLQTLLQARAEVDMFPAQLSDCGIQIPKGTVFLEPALHSAARNGNAMLVRMLLDAGTFVDGRARQASTALQISARRNEIEIVQILLMKGADVNAHPEARNGRTALQAAVTSGNCDIIQILLNAGANINDRMSHIGGRTALQAAAAKGDVALIELLLSLGAKVNFPAAENGGRTALQAAVERNHISSVRTLLAAGADVDAIPGERNGVSALHAAILKGNPEMIQLLLHHTTKLEGHECEPTPLQLAALQGNTMLVNYLILAGVDVNARGKGDLGFTALQAAVKGGHIDVANILLSAKANIDAPSNPPWETALQVAARTGNTILVRLLLANGANPNGRASPYCRLGDLNRTALEEAVSNDPINVEIVYALIEAGANVEGSSMSNEFWPLGRAATKGDLRVVQMLLDAGADLNVPAAESQPTALQAAVERGNIRLVRYLLQRGADVNAPPAKRYGATALQRAAIIGHLRIFMILLEAGADINAPAAKELGRTALEAAAEHGRLDILHLLLKNDGEQDTLDARCEQAAKLATENGHLIIASILRGHRKS